MVQPNKHKVINDPVYGFLTIPSPLVFDVIQHPFFQRLRRIRQLGLNDLVYPGATHTRFAHALGALNLMVRAVNTLKGKGVDITPEEEEAAWLGILLHDIGHGPFSHTLEHTLVKGVHHEKISLLMMKKINREFEGKLDLAIKVFSNQYQEKPFLHQLISGQLDMDRLDYLIRDSFYSGVSEGVVGVDRLIHMLNVSGGQLVVEEKGIYSVEKFLIARRLMYWQVYLHKTVIAADELLLNILKRARFLAESGHPLGNYFPLIHFLGRTITERDIDDETLDVYALLDDNDILNALKTWLQHEDRVLRTLSRRLLDRDLPKIRIAAEAFTPEVILDLKHQAVIKFQLNSLEDADYFVTSGQLENNAYKSEAEGINILKKDGSLADVALLSDNYNLNALTKTVVKHYITF